MARVPAAADAGSPLLPFFSRLAGRGAPSGRAPVLAAPAPPLLPPGLLALLLLLSAVELLPPVVKVRERFVELCQQVEHARMSQARLTQQAQAAAALPRPSPAFRHPLSAHPSTACDGAPRFLPFCW